MKHPHGYIALVSVLLISITLLVLTVSVSLTGFYARANILNSEVKEQSAALAESCIHKAIADIAVGSTVVGTVEFGTNPFTGGPHRCEIVAVVPSGGTTRIKARGIFRNSYTNLVVDIDNVGQNIVSWREYPTMP